jgi:carbonic anhydrase
MKKVYFVLHCFLVLSIGNVFSDMITPAQILQRLLEGNQRFSTDQSTHPDRTKERRQETAAKQEPIATIVGCSDSRVPSEIIFDQGIGDLFIVRVAGNVVGPLELDSVEYSVIYLNSPLVLVMGHENCGAVQAVINGTTQDIESVAELIAPAAKATAGQKENRVENTIKVNVRNMADQLRKSPVLRRLIDQKKLLVVGGYYNFHTGKVEILKD